MLDGVGTVLATGGTLDKAFSMFEHGAETAHERELAGLLRVVLERGEGLTPARELLDRALAPGVGMVLASAEQSGRLDVAAIRLSEMMRRYASHRKAFMFSIFQITFALSVAVVVPTLFQPLAKGIALVAIGLAVVFRWESGRAGTLTRAAWRLPLLGESLQGPAIIRIFTVLGLGVESGRSLELLLAECAEGEPNAAAARACELAGRNLAAGATLADSLSESLALKGVEVALLQQGEHIGKVPATLHRIAEERLQRLGKVLRATGIALIALPYILLVVPFIVLVFVLAQDMPSP